MWVPIVLPVDHGKLTHGSPSAKGRFIVLADLRYSPNSTPHTLHSDYSRAEHTHIGTPVAGRYRSVIRRARFVTLTHANDTQPADSVRSSRFEDRTLRN